MRWADVESRQPRLADLCRRRLLEPGVVLVVTVRRDGAPRLSPVEPFVQNGELLLSMMWRSLKARDLLRDPRILVHNAVTSRDGAAGEVKVRGTVRTIEDPASQRRYADGVSDTLGWEPVPGHFHLFRVDIDTISAVRYDPATGDQWSAVWPPGREFVRRATTPTSVGPPEPTRGLLRTD